MAVDEKIKVCHLISGDLWAGAEVQMFTLVKAIAQKDCGVKISAVVMNDGELAQRLRELRLEVYVLDETKFGFRQLRRMLGQLLDQLNPHILHTHRYKENVLGALAKKERRVGLLVQTVHGVQEKLRGVKWLKGLVYDRINEHYSRRFHDRIICVSEEIRRRLTRKYEAARLVTIHNGIDTESIRVNARKEEIRRQLGIVDACFVVGSVGRLVPVKGFDVFLRMAQMVVTVFPQTRFLLVGSGPLLEDLQRQSHALGLDDRVIFTGFRRDVIDVMNVFDLFVVSSYHEGIPMAVLECMAIGKPVVSTAVGGMPEIIEHGLSGLLVPKVEATLLASACVELLRDQNRCQKMGQVAAAKIKSEYSVVTQRDKVVNLYHELAASLCVS